MIKTRIAILDIRVDARAPAARGGAWMTRIVAAAMLCLLVPSAHGCSLFHREPAQQKFMNALDRGSGVEASQVWLKMSAKDRSNLSHNIGLKPQVDKDDIRALLKHQQEEAAKSGEGPDPTMSAGDNSDGAQIEIPGFDGDPTAGGLSNHPLLNTLPQSAPITEIGPQ
jgi:hypothetical protein